MKGLLRRFVFAHRLFGIGTAFGVACSALFGREDSGRTGCELIVHAHDNAQVPERLLGGNPRNPCGSRRRTRAHAGWAARIHIEQRIQPHNASNPARFRFARPITVRRLHFNEELIAENLVLSFEPNPFTAAMMASEMPAAIKPYSIAVAALSSFKKREMSCTILSLLCRPKILVPDRNAWIAL
jgi:hypothetical protein